MGLDATIYKRPKEQVEEVKYWRKNWVLQNWMESENCVDKVIDEQDMQNLLEFIDGGTGEGSAGWTDDDWDAFADDVREVIEDMKRNETYEYTYNGWW